MAGNANVGPSAETGLDDGAPASGRPDDFVASRAGGRNDPSPGTGNAAAGEATAGLGPAAKLATAQAQEGPAKGRLPAAAGVHGVSDTTFEVGMVDADTTAAFTATNAATGSSAQAGSFSFRERDLAAVDAVNSMGGIAGREVVPVIYNYNVSNFFTASGRQREEQAACAYWTEDHHVFAFSGTASTEGGMVDCAARSQTPMLPTSYHLRLTDERIRSTWTYYYEPSDPRADRANRALARLLLRHGFFGEGAKVGLMVENKPEQVKAAEAMKQELAKAGVDLVEEIHYPDQVQSPWDTYVLQLQSAGVTNVLWAMQSSQVLPAVSMMQAAENQHYRPKWGFGSDMTFNGLPSFNAPPEQMANVLGMGWLPIFDSLDATPEAVNAEHAAICDAQLEKRAQTADSGGLSWGRQQCEWLFFLKVAFEHAPEVSPAGLAAGVEAMGDTFGSVMTIGGRTSFADRHDGVTTVRVVAYDRATNTFKYTGEPEPIPDD